MTTQATLNREARINRQITRLGRKAVAKCDITAKRNNTVTVDACWLPMSGNLAEKCIVETFVQYANTVGNGKIDAVAVNAGHGAVIQLTGDKATVQLVGGLLAERADWLNK